MGRTVPEWFSAQVTVTWLKKLNNLAHDEADHDQTIGETMGKRDMAGYPCGNNENLLFGRVK